MSHTPGPWRYQRSGYGSKQADFDIVSEAGGRVASTPYEDKARLIAAAPDLLAALREILANAQAPAKDAGQLAALVLQVEDAARAAIAKAEAA